MLSQVLSHAEGPACPRQYDAPDGGILGHLYQGREQGVFGGYIQRVHRLGTIESHRGHAVGNVEQHLCHLLSAPCLEVCASAGVHKPFVSRALCRSRVQSRFPYWGRLAR